MTAPLLVFAWGNASRGDDALGPLFVAQLRGLLAARDDVECLDDYQLQVEHALDLVGRQRVLFVDASLGCVRPFEVSRVVALADHSISTHALSPQALLQVFLRLQPGPAPECTLLAIRGESFELGEPPGAAARSHLQAALRWVPAWLDGSCTMSSGAAT